ncbi:MAG: AAA family ATPase [Myxococcota bacterium]
MNRDDLLFDAYVQTEAALTYHLSRAVAATWPDAAILETEDGDFDVATFLEREPCDVVVHPTPHPVFDLVWRGPEKGLAVGLTQGHRSVTWSSITFEVVDAQWPADWGHKRRRFFIGPSDEAVRRFVDHVARVAGKVEDEVMVFSDGCFSRNRDLRKAIRSATFDNLILPGDLGRKLLAQCKQFLHSREQYARFGVPWKRGILLLGPPGNGKTHCIKALLNALDLPCFYIQSFASQYGTPESNVHQVFERARRTSPCVLVLEDLDSLLTKETRSFFLNELDGFATNEGILTLASTNHPDRLDPAILDRPSRFDRKVHFDLPDEWIRRQYIDQLTAQMGVDLADDHRAALAEQTDGFSFAYLKELMISSVTEWIGAPKSRPLSEIAEDQAKTLRGQLGSSEDARPRTTMDEDEDEA